MATDLATRKSPSKSEAYLQRKFAELCVRIKRVDVVAHLLGLAITIFTYALFLGCLDWLAGSSTALAVQVTRWTTYAAFLIGVGVLGVQTVRCCLRRVNPYYVAHQIERSVPGAKNSLINWLDMHEQGLPAAFQKNLSAVAAEQFEECDTERMVPRRKNRVLLGVLGAPALGLAILLVLGPAAFLSSMLRAFLPFYTPAPAPRTLITILEPKDGDAEVGPAQGVTFAVKIDGRVPSGKQKPTLHYRWNADDDFLTMPLQAEGGGVWSAQLLPAQLRAGVAYKITAGDAETPVYQIRTRAAAHVNKFAITYQHRPFRHRKDSTSVFPDDKGTRPIIHGPPGSEVELTIHASRPVKSARVEIATKHGKRDLPVRMSPDDPQAFTCRFTLEQPGQFRVLFTTPDGEDNADRDAYPILIAEDDAPKVVLTQPGIDVSLPENGTLIVAGSAVSPLGVKGLTLRLRIIDGPDQAVALLPQPFRPDVSFQFADGSYPAEIAYQDFVPLDQFKNEKGTIRLLRPGNVIEYWLEATDAADFPNAAGNIGRSAAFKVTLSPKAKDAAARAARDEAKKGRKKFEDKQDEGLAKKRQEPKGGSSGTQNPQDSLNKIDKELNDAKQKLEKANKDQQQGQGKGESKGADRQNSQKKEGPQNPGDGPQPKPSPMSPPDDAGDKKDQGKGQGGTGEARDDGSPQPKKEEGSKGDKKDGSKNASAPAKDNGGGAGKQEPAGGTRDGGPMGKNGPDKPPAKDNAAGDNAPMPSAKNSKPEGPNKDAPSPAATKGFEQNGPDLPNKDQETAANPMPPPGGKAKAGKMTDSDGGESKQGPADQAAPGQARGDEQKNAPQEQPLDALARHLQNLPRDDGAGDAAGRAIAQIAKNAADPEVRGLAKEILAKNGRDPKTGEKEKAPNPYAKKPGVSQGVDDDIKAAAANREFAARIGQMQLDGWKKRLTPDLLKKAGMSEADWQRYVKNQESYDALVRQLNAEAALKALKKLSQPKSAGTVIRTIESQAGNDSLQGSNAPPPLELLDALKRQAEREKK